MASWKTKKQIALSGFMFATASFFAAERAVSQVPAEAGQAPAPAAQPADSQAVPAPRESESPDELAEIIVTGTSIRGVPPTGSNLISVSRDDIDAVGATTAPDLLATVPQLNSFNTAPRANNAGAGAFAPGLRSLPASATLPLLNGHRVVAGAANETNPDFPFLPDLALERVEIVADGASAIYGSDAVAGVVNFITRKNYSGFQLNVRHGVGDEYDASSASALGGYDWGSGSFLIAYQYADSDNVIGADRDYRIQDFRPYGGVDTRATSCPSPNVTITGLTYYAAPALAPNTVNYCDNGAVADLVPASKLHSGFLSAQQAIGDRLTVWGDVLYSDRRDTFRAAPPVQTVTLLATNPYFQAPPGTGAFFEFVLFRPDNLFGSDHVENTYHVQAGNSSAGVDFRLSDELKLSVYGTYDWSNHDAYLPMINPVALTAAAAGTTTATALDPFGTRTAPAVVDAITNYSTTVGIQQQTYLGAAKIDGALADLPGGQLKIAVGAEYRRETFEQRGFVGATQVPEDLGRNIESLYGEVFLPIVGADNSLPLVQNLALSLSGRYDRYSDFGSTTNPKVGFDWKPIEDLTVRGTYGRSFRAPGLRDVGATVGSYYLSAANAAVFLRDPARGAAQVNTVYLLGGNLDLQPEKARTYSFGLDWQPSFAPDLNASATFYDIEYTEVIATPATSIVFTDPTFASVVYRDPSAAQLASLLNIAVPVTLPTPLPPIGNLVDLRRGNFGVRNTSGIDFDINYRHPTSFGALFGGLAGNYILEFDSQLSPTAPVSDALTLGVPKATLRATLGAQIGAFSVLSFVNHRDGVTNTFATPTGTDEYDAGSYTTADLRVVWSLPESGWGKELVLALQVNDVFDEAPPFFPATDGIGGNYNPIGRFIALDVRKAF